MIFAWQIVSDLSLLLFLIFCGEQLGDLVEHHVVCWLLVLETRCGLNELAMSRLAVSVRDCRLGELLVLVLLIVSRLREIEHVLSGISKVRSFVKSNSNN